MVAATVQEGTPGWLTGAGKGWITAEYALLPRSVPQRKERRISGREKEISRIVGRSLRAGVNLEAMEGFTIIVDCDVIQADAGTRCACITGGFVALSRALQSLMEAGAIATNPIKTAIAGVSVAVVKGEILLDPDYEEDSSADVDANIVFNRQGHLVELGMTAEHQAISPKTLSEMIEIGWQGAEHLFRIQKEALP